MVIIELEPVSVHHSRSMVCGNRVFDFDCNIDLSCCGIVIDEGLGEPIANWAKCASSPWGVTVGILSQRWVEKGMAGFQGSGGS